MKSGDPPPLFVRVQCWYGWVGRVMDLRVRASVKVAFEKYQQSGNQWILQLCQTVEINHPCWCGGSNEATIMPLLLVALSVVLFHLAWVVVYYL
jgi:hypothetical protein